MSFVSIGLEDKTPVNAASSIDLLYVSEGNSPRNAYLGNLKIRW